MHPITRCKGEETKTIPIFMARCWVLVEETWEAAGAFRRPLLSSCARDRGRIGEKTPNFRHHGHGHESDALRFDVLLSLILITDVLVETMHELLSSALGCLRSEQGLQRPLVDMYQKTTRSVPTA